MNPKQKEEKNLYQKYDDLFDKQDKKYDKNNHSRYSKNKNQISIHQDDVHDAEQKRLKKKVQNNIYTRLVFVLVGFGFLLNFIISDSSVEKAWLTPLLITGAVIFIIGKAAKNK
ncbi:MAG: hypothetical protein ABH890_03850 [Bacillota bacterium]